jgi:hypothetical protein
VEKVYRRLWWKAQLSRLVIGRPECELWPEPGCRRVIVRVEDGRTVRDFPMPDALLHAMAGERYVCLGPGLDDAVALEVVTAGAGEIRARLLGDLQLDEGIVQLALLSDRDTPTIARAQARRAATPIGGAP